MYPVRIAFDKQKPDRRDDMVKDHLEKGQWRAALRLIELQSRKGTTQRLAVNKSLIQLASDDTGLAFEGLSAIQQLILSKDSPITDIEILEAIDYSLPTVAVVRSKELLSVMWERAMNVVPKSVQILEGAFSSACKNTDFASGRKVSDLLLNASWLTPRTDCNESVQDAR